MSLWIRVLTFFILLPQIVTENTRRSVLSRTLCVCHHYRSYSRLGLGFRVCRDNTQETQEHLEECTGSMFEWIGGILEEDDYQVSCCDPIGPIRY